MKKRRYTALFVCAALLAGVCGSVLTHAAESRFTEKSAEEFLLSEDFFDYFYGAPAVELIDFSSVRNTLELPFKTDTELSRACLDLPFKTDCSSFSSYELIADVDEPSAIGSVTLYFHSGGGWYSLTGSTKRNANGRVTVLFNAKEWRTEGSPEGYDKIDLVRFSFWRGGTADGNLTFKGFRALRGSFGVLDGYQGEDQSFIGLTSSLFARCGLPCERVDASSADVETLKRYKAILLAIGGRVPDATVDALCEYVDAGGFLILCYNPPEKLLRKIGAKTTGFVNCAREKLEISGMALEPELVARAAERGFELPEFISQNSWNFRLVETLEDFEATRVSPITGDNKARVLASWKQTNGSATDYPALVVSGNGLFCSHVLLTEDFDAKKTLLSAIGLDVAPETMRGVVHQDWLSVFAVGLDPDSDLDAARVETLNYLQKELRLKNRSLADVAEILDASSSETDPLLLRELDDDVLDVKSKRVNEFLSAQPSRPKEGRLWWEHSGCGIWKGDWDRSMKALADAGFNGVIPNMLWGGAAYYNSEVLPVAPVVERYGDQIEQAVAAGKKYGVEVHVWMVCFNASNSSPEFLDQMRKEGRLQHTIDGEEQSWLCPSDPRNRALQKAALEEVATKYDVDGVHFDYIRFPDDNTCFCDGCRERFANAYEEATGKKLEGELVELVKKNDEVGNAWRQWRCDQITALVHEVSDSLRAKRPDIQISAAVFPGYPGTKSSIGQDWGLWIEKGWLDFVCPMDYTSDPGAFKGFVERQLPYTRGKCPIYPGIGMTATGISMKPEEVVLQAKLARDAGAEGFTIFNLTESTAKAALPAFKEGATSSRTERARETP